MAKHDEWLDDCIVRKQFEIMLYAFASGLEYRGTTATYRE